MVYFSFFNLKNAVLGDVNFSNIVLCIILCFDNVRYLSHIHFKCRHDTATLMRSLSDNS